MAEVSLKRYRYTGKERDTETGFCYHSARYYAPWLGRWTSCDPAGVSDGLNLYQYVSNNPVRLVDPQGKGAWDQFMGGVKMVGGGLEAAAGGAMILVGAATSEALIGVPIAAAGIAVGAHGLDVTVSGARTMVNGAPVDTYTSQTLQAYGMTRTGANLTDAGLSIAGTLGAGAATRVPGAVATVADSVTASEGATETANSVSVALQSPAVVGPISVSGATVNAAVGANVLASSEAPDSSASADTQASLDTSADNADLVCTSADTTKNYTSMVCAR